MSSCSTLTRHQGAMNAGMHASVNDFFDLGIIFLLFYLKKKYVIVIALFVNTVFYSLTSQALIGCDSMCCEEEMERTIVSLKM